MKKIICILLAMMPLFAVANNDDKKNDNDNYNPKYLTGAVTLTDGKVIFQQTFNAPNMSKDAIYDQLANWANGYFQPKDGMNSRVVYTNKEEGQIAVAGEQYIVFSSSALSLDRTRIYYHLHMFASDGKYEMKMSRIRYWYDENRNGGEKYTAEEWIVDDMALMKKKNKLAPICGKFRRETIDLKDELFGQSVIAVSALFNQQTQTAQVATPVQTQGVTPANAQQTQQVAVAQLSQQAAATQQTAAQQVQPSVDAPVAPVQSPAAPKALTEISLSQLPSNLSEIAAAGRITITAGEEEIEVKPETWGGFGKLLNKDVAYTVIDKSRIAISLIMENSDAYKISFYQTGNTKAYVVIDCKKTMKQELTADELKALNQQVDANKKYVMYIGAISKCMMQK